MKNLQKTEKKKKNRHFLVKMYYLYLSRLRYLHFQVIAMGEDMGRHNLDACLMEVVEDILMQMGVDV